MSSSARKSVAHNTLMLYLLKGSVFLFSFITIPYLTRVLGPETYGLIGFATACSAYVQIVLDFGFILSGTEQVLHCNGNVDEISEVMSSVMGARMILAIVTAFACLPIFYLVDQFKVDPLLFWLYYLYALANALLPDFVYRGLEHMSMITLMTVIVRAIFLVLILVFVSSPGQYRLVPLFYLLGSCVAMVVAYSQLSSRYGIRLQATTMASSLDSLRRSAYYFLSRVASSFYSSLNTIVIGFIAPGSATLGHFSAASNVINAGKNMSSPIADSFFPYMLRTKNYKLLVKVVLVGELFVAIPCVVFGILAPEICLQFFGNGYAESGRYIRILLPLIPIALASYMFGFPALSPLGLSKTANSSVILGAVLQVAMLLGLHLTGCLDAVTICISTVVTESVVLMVRIIAFARGVRSVNQNA